MDTRNSVINDGQTKALEMIAQVLIENFGITPDLQEILDLIAALKNR